MTAPLRLPCPAAERGARPGQALPVAAEPFHGGPFPRDARPHDSAQHGTACQWRPWRAVSRWRRWRCGKRQLPAAEAVPMATTAAPRHARPRALAATPPRPAASRVPVVPCRVRPRQSALPHVPRPRGLATRGPALRPLTLPAVPTDRRVPAQPSGLSRPSPAPTPPARWATAAA